MVMDHVRLHVGQYLPVSKLLLSQSEARSARMTVHSIIAGSALSTVWPRAYCGAVP
jgi:hypothetical protein